jgi:hypothetical protein
MAAVIAALDLDQAVAAGEGSSGADAGTPVEDLIVSR